MAEGSLASAVALPDQDSNNLAPSSPEAGLKRRKSSITDSDNKRRRLSSQDDRNNVDEESNTNSNNNEERRPSSPADRNGGTERELRGGRQSTGGRGGRDEERKRGQRLFGALLGTLSQSSNTAAQRRRADIEKRQQAKLKMQDEEYDELKKKRREELTALRKKEQRVFERESMRTRHSNMLAMAHFLKTKTEPVLYYKPWQLRPEDETVIREQIEEAEATTAQEVADFDAQYPPEEEVSKDSGPQPEKLPEQGQRQGQGLEQEQEREREREREQHLEGKEPSQAAVPDTDTTKESKDAAHEAPDTVGAGPEITTNHDKEPEVPRTTDVTPTTNNGNVAVNDQTDVHRGAEDDGGEVVEDKEDTVIY